MSYDAFDLLRNYTGAFLKSLNLKAGEGYFIGSGINAHKIEGLSKKLSLKFSPSYIDFLTNFGETSVEGYDIYGFAEKSMHNGVSVVDKTNFYKQTQKWPGIEDWYVISDDGRGNPIGCKPDGSVWLSDHDAGFEQVKLADNFEQFLYKLLTNTLYEE